MRPTRRPTEYQTFAPVGIGSDGAPTRLAASLKPDDAGLEGYLTLTYVLADRGMFFRPGAFTKTAVEQIDHTFHLLQHWPDLVLGKHAAAGEDRKGFRVAVQINEGKPLGAEVMSDYRFGIPYAWSVGFTVVADESGTEKDDKRLDRRTVPELANVPINELRAIKEARWFESSTVTWGSLEDAGPDVVQSAFDDDAIEHLLSALKAGTATQPQLAHAKEIAAALQSRAGAGSDHATRTEDDRDRRNDLVLVNATLARLRALGLETAA